jgi:hypothetical protein
MKALFSKTLAALALAGLLFATAPAAKADTCDRRINYTQMRYREAVHRFGPASPAARHWRYERHEAFVHCRR